MPQSRRRFLRTACSISIFPLASSAVVFPDPPLSDKLIEAFVREAHRDLSAVREMLEEHPTLLNAAWDWGGGDFETAIGGAGHVGNREIAEFLIEKGARANLFTFTMLGQAGLVRPVLEAYPVLLHSAGPHGFSLLHHARVGGEVAAELAGYLQEKGLQTSKW